MHRIGMISCLALTALCLPSTGLPQQDARKPSDTVNDRSNQARRETTPKAGQTKPNQGIDLNYGRSLEDGLANENKRWATEELQLRQPEYSALAQLGIEERQCGATSSNPVTARDCARAAEVKYRAVADAVKDRIDKAHAAHLRRQDVIRNYWYALTQSDTVNDRSNQARRETTPEVAKTKPNQGIDINYGRSLEDGLANENKRWATEELQLRQPEYSALAQLGIEERQCGATSSNPVAARDCARAAEAKYRAVADAVKDRIDKAHAAHLRRQDVIRNYWRKS